MQKTFATRLADEGITEGDIADMLGHTSISTTRQYYKKKTAEQSENGLTQ
ncbi:MAG: tyrosine-type recombinase/integrase [Ignavibacteria bacterium]|nr:tyrosine-type recombinase/integrase [Ignavibacteria bacterium]